MRGFLEAVTPASLCALAAHLVFAAVSVRLVVVDLREHRLPNRTVAGGTLSVAALLLAAALAANASPESGGLWRSLGSAAIAGLAYGLGFFVLWWVSPTAVGAGDVKLAPLVGLVAGWSGPWVAALWVPLGIGVIGCIAGLISRARQRGSFAFGPVMIAACWVGVLLAGVGWG